LVLALLDAYDLGRLGRAVGRPNDSAGARQQKGSTSMSPADWELAKANTLATRNPNPLDHDAQVASLLARGYHVEIQTAELTQLVRGHRVNHILHLLLTVFTAGLWLPVWIGVAAFGGGRRKTIAR
jgi:hypothetical protein